jgi:serine/threonine protein kinase
MGVVYRATDARLGREVALKVLTAGPGSDPELDARLRREAKAAAALTHPAICVIYEIDEADGATFIAMELVRGRPLAALVHPGLEAARALETAIEVAEGLAEAHRRGIVHRDLKPSNVMITESGHAKIIDFGLAKFWKPLDPLESGADTPARGQTDPGRILGTAAYMSPEQVRGAPVDPRSDVFAFGALLYEMLSGAPAFRRETGVETLHAILRSRRRGCASAASGPPPVPCSRSWTPVWPRNRTTATRTWRRFSWICVRRASASRPARPHCQWRPGLPPLRSPPPARARCAS